MEDWSRVVLRFIDDISVEVEQLFTEVGNATETFTDEVINAFEDFSNHVIEDIENLTYHLEDSIFINFEEYYQELFEAPDLEIYINNSRAEIPENYYYEQLEINPKIQPNLVTHPACINCVNYHGRIYGDNLLVCGMHPYGWEDQNCPDWEANN